MNHAHTRRLSALLLAALLLAAAALSGCGQNAAASASSVPAAAEAEPGGENEKAIAQYGEYGGAVFKAKLIASVSDRYEGAYAGTAESHLALLLTDWTGEGELLGYVPRESDVGQALAALLEKSGSAKVLLRLRLTGAAAESGAEEAAATARIVALLSPDWHDPEEENAGILESAAAGDAPETRVLLDAGASPYALDANGDGLIFLALRSGNLTLADLLASYGAPLENHNYLCAQADLLTGSEQTDIADAWGVQSAGGSDPGCTCETLLGYFVRSGAGSAVDWLLENGAEASSLSEYATLQLAARYGVPAAEGVRANELDLALAGGETEIARALLASGAQPSSLLLAKIADNMDFSSKACDLLGEYDYFGVLDSVIADYAAFRAAYDKVEALAREYNDRLAEYELLESQGRTFDAVYVLSREIYPAAKALKTAADALAEPATPEIAAVLTLTRDYASLVMRAANNMNNINGNIVKSGRNYLMSLHDRNQSAADAKLAELEDRIDYYDSIASHLSASDSR